MPGTYRTSPICRRRFLFSDRSVIRLNGARVLIVVVICLLAFSGCTHQTRLKPGMPVEDGFESSKIGDLWELDKILPGDIEIQSATVMSGHSAVKITLHRGDMGEKGTDGDSDSERAEMTEAEDLYSRDGETCRFDFSLFIPSDFPILPTRLILAQWKQECPGGGKCGNNSPVLALRYVGGTLAVTQTIGSHRSILWQSTNDMRNRWLAFSFQIRFSPSADGRIVARLNDTLLVERSGPSAYAENAKTGYSSPSRYYFKMGLYRDTITESMTIYLDAYRKSIISSD